jgi:hypothetical protein
MGGSQPRAGAGGFNYLLVTLKRGERWTYAPPAGHSVAWLAVAKGSLLTSEQLAEGEIAIFEAGEAPITLQGNEGSGTTFVLGSAVPHPHDLHLGYYSVSYLRAGPSGGRASYPGIGRATEAASDRRTASGSMPVFR